MDVMDVMDLMVISRYILDIRACSSPGRDEVKTKRKPPQRGLGERDVEVHPLQRRMCGLLRRGQQKPEAVSGGASDFNGTQ